MSAKRKIHVWKFVFFVFIVGMMLLISQTFEPAYATDSGELTGSITKSSYADVNLTSLGDLDWAIWGYGTSASLSPYISMSGGDGISNLAEVDSGLDDPLRGLGQFNINHTFCWTNGTGMENATNIHCGIQQNVNSVKTNPGEIGNGFSFTVPADKTKKRLIIYTATHFALGELTATLSDGSATQLTLQHDANSGNAPSRFVIDYVAGADNQMLTVRFVTTSNTDDNGCGNVQIYAVALSDYHTATINICKDGTALDESGSVELKQSGSTVATATSTGVTGVYLALVLNGTYDIYIGGADTRKDITINATDNSATVNYYTVSFSVTDAGTASGSTISATAGGSTITSGDAVLAGKAVAITAAGAGATTYAYAWSGDGTSGATTDTLSISSLSDTIDATCTVTGTTNYTATVNTKINGTEADVTGTVELKKGGSTKATLAKTAVGTYAASVVSDTYDVYINDEDTGVDITVGSGGSNSATVNYYTVSFSVTDAGTASGSTISATAGGSTITSGDAVLAEKAVAITAAGAGATTYAYAWSGDGTSGATAAALTITSLSGKIDAECTVTGTTMVMVMFDAGGGSVTPFSQTKRYGSIYGKSADGTSDEALPTPTKTGHTFAGWWTGVGGTGTRIADTTTVTATSNHTLYAKWAANQYTVTFDTNGGSAVNDVTQDYGTVIASSPETTKTGYTFSGWYSNAALTETVTFPYTITTGATLYAKWTTDSYMITFYSSGAVYTVTSADGGEKISAPDDPTCTGYTFGGWYKESACTNKWDFNTDTITANVYLYAKWTIKTYTVTFKDWDGTVLRTQTVKYGKVPTAPDDPERTGYTFVGWNKAFDKITYNMTVIAQYTVNTYTVTFNTNGGSNVVSQKVKYGADADEPDDPTLDGYSFDGWYSDSGFSKAYDFSTEVTANIALYAKWTEIADTAQAAAQALTMETAFEFAEGGTWECVTSSFVMLGSANSGVQVTWTSSNADIVRIEQNTDGSATGIVTRPQDNDASVVITATVTKDSDTVSKTFLLIVKREGASKEETREATERTASVRAGDNAGNETIYRTTLKNGTNIDYVMVTTETVQALIGQGNESDHIVVEINNDEDDPADEFAFEVSSDTVTTLANIGLGVTLKTPAGIVTLSADVLEQAVQLGASLYFRIVPVAEESDEAQGAFFGDRTIFSLSNVAGQVFGTPKTIQTNMENYATTITLPLEGLSEEQLADEAFLKTLCVYVEHDDGTTELVYGTLVYTDNMPTGIRFDISKFSRFQVVSVEQAASSPWIWIVCIASGVLLVLIILLLVIVQRRKRQTQVQF